MQEPLTIQGPAIVTFNSMSYYVQKDVKVDYKRETFNPASAIWGEIGERHKSDMFEISFTPVGQLPSTSNFTSKYYPYTPSLVGKSILGGAVVIHSFSQGKTYTYHRGGITKMATLFLHPLKTLFGPMTMVAIGKAATDATDAAFMKTVATAAFADTSFDGAQVTTEIYEAAWGPDAPYSAMGSHDGFEVEQTMSVKNLESADRGITDIILEKLGCTVKFPPSNLTHAQIDTLLNFQDAAVKRPGATLGGTNDLVITGTTLTVTCVKVGPKGGGYIHELGVNEAQGVEFVNNMVFASGVGQRLVTFA
jgi:hypothetical protein